MKLILFRGRPGTGKTFLSALFAEALQLPVLRKDDLYDAVSSLHPDHRLRNKATYDALYAILQSNRSNNGVWVLDFPFQTPEGLAQLTAWCTKHAVRLQSILVVCSNEQLWAARFNRRALHPLPNQLITDFEVLRTHYDPLQLRAGAGELLVDTTDTAEQNLEKINSFVYGRDAA